jgi:hypothetical protein
MYPSPEENLRSYMEYSKELRRKVNTPAKARAYLLKIGILEKHAKSPHGVRLAKQYRSPDD